MTRNCGTVTLRVLVYGEKFAAKVGCERRFVADTPLQVTGSRARQETPSVFEVLEGATKRSVVAVQDYAELSF